MHKYIFQDGGEAQDDSSFFNNYADSLLNQVDKTVPEDYQVDLSSYYEQDTENEYIRGLRESDPEQNPELDLENKYNDFSSKIDSYFEEKMNEYQNQLMIADFYGSQEGQENLSRQYDVKDETVPYTSNPVATTGSYNGVQQLKGNTAAARNNNPGNIKYAAWMKDYGAVVGSKALDGGNFAKFPSVQNALEARKKLLTRPLYANKTVDAGLKMYSGNGYDGGIYPEIRNKLFKDLTENELNELLKRQLKSEDGNVAKQLGIN